MRNFLCAVVGVLLLAGVAFADDKDKDKPKPNPLTPKEIADGWILLFDGETTFGWKIDGDAKVKDGVLLLAGGEKPATAAVNTRFAVYELHMELDGPGEIGLKTSDNQVGLTLTGQPTSLSLKARSGDRPVLEMSSMDTPNKTVRVTAEAKSNGAAQVILTAGQRGTLAVRLAKLRPLETKPLFTGKNLDGWKINAADPKRMASKWEVTTDGELSLKNGPGDLVTEKEFDNFVLQLECKTLGDGLNSGFFFRCIPGQYQNGYEAQIQNTFVDGDRTKPKDFGSGAIYRRIAARKVVANDKEWFTMTVVADGKHIATWVNGYQTVDWIDDRKENENPRQGYRAAKGPISIQGHDPTTDLLFRNIRIAELGGEKKE